MTYERVGKSNRKKMEIVEILGIDLRVHTKDFFTIDFQFHGWLKLSTI